MAEEKTLEVGYSTEPLSVEPTLAEYLPLLEKLRRADVAVGPQLKAGQFEKVSGTGSQAITGVGFRPRLVVLDAVGTANNSGESKGLYDTATYNIIRYWNGAQWNGDSSSTYIIQIYNSAGSQYLATMTSLDADGFTLNWSGTAVSCKVNYQCFA